MKKKKKLEKHYKIKIHEKNYFNGQKLNFILF